MDEHQCRCAPVSCARLSLHGLAPDSSEDFGVNLGSMVTRGERGRLIVSLDSRSRMCSNPFFPYMQERIEEGIGGGQEEVASRYWLQSPAGNCSCALFRFYGKIMA